MSKNSLSNKPTTSHLSNLLQSWKKELFESTAVHLQENESASPMLYYIMEILETLAFTWFFIHPVLNIYEPNSILLSQASTLLKMINFYEFLVDDPNLYQSMLLAILFLYLAYLLLYAMSHNIITKKKKSNILRYIKKIVNIYYILLFKVLSGPCIGLTINVLYCSPESPYHKGQECYNSTYIFYCIIAAVLLFNFIAVIIYAAFFYFIKNPFSNSYLGYPNRNYVASKSLIKLLFPLFFAVNNSLQLEFLFVIMAPVLWGLYIFYHRIFSLHSYKHQHFYVEYFCQSFLLWLGVSGMLSYYINGAPSNQPMGFIYNFVCSLLIGFGLIFIQKSLHQQFMTECLQGNIKKQSIERFVLWLISSMFHVRFEEGKLTFEVYSRIIMHRKNDIELKASKIVKKQSKNEEENLKRKMHQFFLEVITKFDEVKEVKQITVKIIRCYLLQFLGYDYFSLHQILEIKEDKLSLVDEFSIFVFLNNYKYLAEENQVTENELIKMFRYQEESRKLDELMSECAANNAQYWQQLTQSIPSLPKIRNLATLYVDYSTEIGQAYKQIKAILPLSKIPTFHYLHFLMQVGADLRMAVKVKEELNYILKNTEKEAQLISGLSGDDIGMVVVDTIGCNLGTILNCNLMVKNILGYSKQAIVGKNVNRLMPKAFTEIHNSFIIKYLRQCKFQQSQGFLSGNHHKNKKTAILQAERIVNALNSKGFIVQITLSIQLISSISNQLVASAFIKKTETTQKLLMVEGNSGQVLGIDETLFNLMLKSHKDKQANLDGVKLSMLLPQINMKQLEEKGTQETILDRGALQDGETHKINAIVTLKQIKTYNQRQILSLSLSIPDIFSHQQLVLPTSNRRRSKRNEKDYFDSERKSNEQLIIEGSSSQIQSSSSLHLNIIKSIRKQQNDIVLNSNDVFVEKIQVFAQNKSGHGFSYCLYLCDLLIIFCLTIYSANVYQSNNNYLDQVSKKYDKMSIISDIPFYQAQVNLYANKMWCYYHFAEKPQGIVHRKCLKKASEALSFTVRQGLSSSQLTDLHNINIKNKANFIFAKIVNQTLQPFSVQMTGQEGVINYINSAESLIDQTFFNNPQPMNKYLISQQVYYITKNGNKILPDMATRSVQNYQQIFAQMNQSAFLSTLYLKLISIMMTLVFLIAVLIVTRSLKNTRIEIFQFYNKLKLWDIHELYRKCQLYQSARGKESFKQRSSSLLKIFPPQTIVDIVDATKNDGHPKKKKTLHTIKAKEEQKPLEASKQERQQEKDEGNCLLQKKNYNVNIDYQSQLKSQNKSLYLIGIISLAGVLVYSVGLYLHIQTAAEFQSKFTLLKNVGIVRKSLTYLNLFSYQIANKQPHYQYVPLVANTAAEFYTYSALTYPELGDSVFHSIYGYVENMKLYFGENPSSYDKNFLLRIYTKASDAFDLASQRIFEIRTAVLEPQFHSLIKETTEIELILILIVILLGVAASLLVHFWHFDPIHRKRIQYANMIKVLPAWMLRRNPEAFAHINN